VISLTDAFVSFAHASLDHLKILGHTELVNGTPWPQKWKRVRTAFGDRFAAVEQDLFTLGASRDRFWQTIEKDQAWLDLVAAVEANPNMVGSPFHQRLKPIRWMLEEDFLVPLIERSGFTFDGSTRLTRQGVVWLVRSMRLVGGLGSGI
jgi:hypothetical protein